MDTIRLHGQDLCSINLLIRSESAFLMGLSPYYYKSRINFIIEGCPKLKNLTLESLRGWKENDDDDLTISRDNLKALYNGCRELKDLKLTKIDFRNMWTEDEIKEIFPDCNVEIKECHFETGIPCITID